MTAINISSFKAIQCQYRSQGAFATTAEIINNSQNQSKTDICVGWLKDKERLFGSAAINNKRNMQWAFNNLTRLIGLTSVDQKQIEKEKLFCYADLKQDEDDKPCFDSPKGRLYIEQVMGAFIRKLNKNFHADEEGEKETIVTYPSFFNAN